MTGLSGSGKTAFITSLVENLISAPEQPARLPFLRAAAERRLLEVVARRSGDDRIPNFPLRDTVAALAADPPRWPASTTDLRRVDLRVRFSPSSRFGFARPPGGAPVGIAEFNLEILDYPGEWLLDLPLLGQSYQQWSAAALALARDGARASLSREWLLFLADHPASSRSDTETARRAHDLYRDFLGACRHQAQLSMLQPGRFLNPGRLAGDVALEFCPMPAIPTRRGYEGSLGRAMEARFEAYKQNVVQPFFAALARGVDRQVVLVDVLRVLNAGEEAFLDQSRALATILDMFRFGRHGFLRRLFGSSRIDRVLFAATKADHVPAVQRDHLEALVADMVAVPRLRAEQSRASVAATALASVRCTVDDTDVIDGRKVDVVIGLPQGGQRRIRFFPGIIPVARPLTGFWGDRFTEFPVFQPPRIDAADRSGIAHVNLDKALNFLFEDVLR
ncbi:MAG: YcjX family protein [Stellaceae bacterium]